MGSDAIDRSLKGGGDAKRVCGKNKHDPNFRKTQAVKVIGSISHAPREKP
jgi:hypothetical protein